MFIELVESLRCIAPHEPTWLVAVADVMRDRHILRGTLGCPTCRATYPVLDGTAYFGIAPDAAAARGRPTAATPEVETGALALRAAALSDLVAPGGFVLLAGDWALAASHLALMADGVHVAVLDAPVPSAEGVSGLAADDTIPLRAASARAIALDEAHRSLAHLAAAVEALRPAGRLIAPADTPVPAGVTVLARDDRDWVAARDAAGSAPLRLERVRR